MAVLIDHGEDESVGVPSGWQAKRPAMSSDLLILLLMVVVVLVGSALCSGVGSPAVGEPVRLHELASRSKPVAGARTLQRLRQRLGRTLSVLVIANNAFNIFGSMMLGGWAARVFKEQQFSNIALPLFSIALTVLVILLGEILPKALGTRLAIPVALSSAPVLQALGVIMRPLVLLLERLLPAISEENELSTDENEIRLLARLGSQQGQIEADEAAMIAKVFQLNDLTARELMTLVAAPTLACNASLHQLRQQLVDNASPWWVVLGKEVDNVLGVASRENLLTALLEHKGHLTALDLAEPVEFVPEMIRVDRLLTSFRRDNSGVRVVVDEFGGFVGVIGAEAVLAVLAGWWRKSATRGRPVSSTATEAPQTTLERGLLWLQHWRNDLVLSGRERSLLAGSLASLDRQLERLHNRVLRVAVFGRVGVGKSSLVNALVGEERMATDVAHGCTRHQQAVTWPQPIEGLQRVELVDTPGIDECRRRPGTAGGTGGSSIRPGVAGARCRHQPCGTRGPGDLGGQRQTGADGAEPQRLLVGRGAQSAGGKHRPPRQGPLRRSRRTGPARTPGGGSGTTSSHPAPGRPRAQCAAITPGIALLRDKLQELLHAQGPALLTLNALRQAERLQHQIEQARLKHRRRDAQGMIGRFAAIKATGVAVNPMVLLDLAGGMARDTALVMQLCQLYELPMGGQRPGNFYSDSRVITPSSAGPSLGFRRP